MSKMNIIEKGQYHTERNCPFRIRHCLDATDENKSVKSMITSVDFTLLFLPESEKELPFYECRLTSL